MVVPRWLARAGFPLPPQGSGKFWGDTAVQLPKSAPKEWKNVFTNGIVKTEAKHGNRAIRIESLAQFPVALLTGEVTRNKS